MPTDRQHEEENTRFQLGVIVGALQELPHRMDRFEASVNNDEVDTRARKAWDASERGEAVLLQRRIREGVCEYLAIPVER